MEVSKEKQITYNTAGNIATLFCQWMIMMIIPKITDFSEAGVFAIALSICSVMNIVATFHLNQYQISDQYARYTENDFRAARMATVTLSFVMCLVVVLLFNYSLKQSLIIVLYMVYRNLIHYAYLYCATLQIRERLDHVGKCMILEGIISFVSFTVSYYVTHDLVSSVAIMAVLGGGVFLLSVAYGYRKVIGRRYPWHSADKTTVSSLLKIGTPLLLSIAAPIAIMALPRIVMQAVDGDEMVGIFSTLAAPTIVIPTLVLGLFTPFIVYFSNICRKGEMTLLRRQYLKMVALTLLLGIICYAVSHFAAGPLFEMVYGSDISPYTRYFEIIIIGITLYSIGAWGITVLITKEQGRIAAIASAISLAAAVAIFLFAVPRYHFDGASYGLVAAYGIFALMVSLFVLLIPLTRVVGIQNKDV
jgi:O-antigen/teichoic acid export membrane protein